MRLVTRIGFSFGLFPAPGRGVRDRSRRHTELGQEDPLQDHPCSDEKQYCEPIGHKLSDLLDAPLDHPHILFAGVAISA